MTEDAFDFISPAERAAHVVGAVNVIHVIHRCTPLRH